VQTKTKPENKQKKRSAEQQSLDMGEDHLIPCSRMSEHQWKKNLQELLAPLRAHVSDGWFFREPKENEALNKTLAELESFWNTATAEFF